MGLTLHSGQPVILRPGRYVLLSPLHSFVEQKSINDDLIEFGPITVVTIKKVGVCVCGRMCGRLCGRVRCVRFFSNLFYL
jgi:hypothetical protein